MGGGRRYRKRKPARRTPWRAPKPRILCVCEGRVTERQYLDGFIAWCRNPRVEVEVDDSHGVPLTLVKRAKARRDEADAEAKREKDENLRYDEVWCVFDIDDHPKVFEAKDMAAANGIEVAISNAAFELWLLLHFRHSPGAQHRKHLLTMLKGFLPDYDKSLRFADIQEGYEAAVVRAQRLDRDAEQMNEAGRNPTTGVWRLTESIRGIDDSNPSSNVESPRLLPSQNDA